MPNYSKALTYAWKCAAYEAGQAKAPAVAPVHLFLGILSLKKLRKPEPPLAPETRAEIDELEAVFQQCEIKTDTVRRELRAWAILGTKMDSKVEEMHRTPESRQVFTDAEHLAAQMEIDPPVAVHLLAALLDRRDEKLLRLLKDCEISDEKIDRLRSSLTVPVGNQKKPVPIPPDAVARRLRPPEPVEETKPKPRKQIQPSAPKLEPKPVLSPTTPTWPLAHVQGMREMARLFATEQNIDTLLAQVPELAIRLIPKATRAAILLKDTSSARLLHKGSHPPDSIHVSESMALQALEHSGVKIFSETPQIEGSIIGYGQAMYVALRWKQQPLGLLVLSHPQGDDRTFSEGDVLIAETLGDWIALAVGQALAQTRVKRQLDLTLRLFASRFSPRVRAELLNRAESDNLLNAQQSPVTVLIADIRGFTRLSSQLGPRQLSDLLNEYFPPVIDAIFKHGGSIERFAGDCVFAVFGSPPLDPVIDADHPVNAVRAAMQIRQAVERVTETRRLRQQETCAFGIGLDTGTVLHGFIGSSERMEFAVIGDPANLASRYCAGAAEGEIVISPQMQQSVWNLVRTEKVSLDTKHEGTIPAYRVLELKRK